MGKGAERVSTRLVLVLSALFLFCLWSFVGYWSLRARDLEIDSSKVTLSRLNTAVEEQTRRMFKLVEVFLDTASLWLDRHPQSDPLTDPQFAALVEGFSRASGDAIQLRVVTRSGALYRIPAVASQPRYQVDDRDYFKAQIEQSQRGFYIGMPVQSRESGQWIIPVSQPLERPNGQVTMLVAAIQIDYFTKLFEQERIHPNGAITLLRRDGVLLARAPHVAELVGKSAAQTDVFSRFLPAAPKGVEFSDSSATDRLTKLTAYAALGDFPLVVIAAASRDDILARWELDLSVISLVGLMLTVLALLAAGRLVWLLQVQRRTQLELFRLATTDELTGCTNRRHFMDALHREFARTRRHGEPLSLMVLDLDFFKRINDGYGHGVGDKALKAFVTAAQSSLRQSDLLARLGGEEFAILLPATETGQVQPVAERLRQQVSAIRIPTSQGTVQFTVSIGVAGFDDSMDSAEALLLAADRALYAAKAAGRDRVVLAPQAVPGGVVELPAS